MDITSITNYCVPAIVAGCLCVGYVLRNWMPCDNKWIPTVLFVLGCISGAIVGGVTYEAIVAGAVSGLAAVGLNQAFKQTLGLNVRADIETTEDEVEEYELAEEDEEEPEEGEENE